MAEAYLGEIRMFAGNYAPVDWALCDGASLSISGNETLYTLLGTTWGGDGVKNFNLPDLRGRIPIGQGAGSGLTQRTLGQKGGVETVTLTVDQIPAHSHTVNVTSSNATTVTPGPDVSLAAPVPPAANYLAAPTTPAKPLTLNTNTIGISGGVGAHNNIMPSFVVNFIICTSGLYPSRP